MERASLAIRETLILNQKFQPLQESKIISLAQRYFIAPEVIKEAWIVFRRYCAIEEEEHQRRSFIMMTSHSPKRSTATTITTNTTNTNTNTSITLNTLTPVPGKRAVSFATVENSRNLQLPREDEVNNNNNNKQDVEEKIQEVHAEFNTSGDAISGPSIEGSETPNSKKEKFSNKEQEEDENEEEEEEEEFTLGVNGLQKFFNDLGMSMSALEVSDMVHTINDDPIDLIMHRRNQDAAAAAAEINMKSNSDSLKKNKSPPRPATLKKKGNNNSSIKDVSPILALENSGKDEIISQSSRTKSSRDSITFPIFLFILSHVLLEKEDNITVKDQEVCELFRCIDKDGDGFISVGDIQNVVKSLIDEGALVDDRDIQKLCTMNVIELKTAIQECDVDGDGRVTLEDLRCVLRS